MKERAEILIKEIDSYVADGLNDDIKSQLTENKSLIEQLLLELNESEFSVSFIGKIGVGKTSAICKASGLQYVSKNKELVDVLKTGAGRTTVCEVRIEYAEKLSIKVDPLGYKYKTFFRNLVKLVIVSWLCVSLFGCVTAGPVFSPQFIDLVHEAINVAPEEIIMLGPGAWYPNLRGFAHGPGGIYTFGVLAVTPSYLFVVQWDKTANNYQVVKRFSLTKKKKVTLDTFGLSRRVVVLWTDYSTDSFKFTSQHAQLIDRSKTESLFKLLSSNMENK